MDIYNKSQETIDKVANKLKSIIKQPEWSMYVKTSAGKERPPIKKDWWYSRAASILRKIYLKGPIGVSKLRKNYTTKKNRGNKPEKTYPSSGKIIRTILQQLEESKLIQKAEKGAHKGKIATKQGISLLNKK